jgi:hypothetical protein
MITSISFRQRYAVEENTASSCHLFTVTMEWKHPGSAKKNKFKGSYLLAKYFCECSAVFLVDILEYERPVNYDK